MELKLAEAKSLNLAQANEIADFKVALKACEESGTMRVSQMLKIPWSPLSTKLSSIGFGEGWMAAL